MYRFNCINSDIIVNGQYLNMEHKLLSIDELGSVDNDNCNKTAFDIACTVFGNKYQMILLKNDNYCDSPLFQIYNPDDIITEPTVFDVISIKNMTLTQCASKGLIDIAKWLLKYGHSFDKDTMNEASKYKQLKFAQWALKEGCPWGDEVISYAAFIQNTCLDKTEFKSMRELDEYKIANKFKQIEFAQWARKEGCPWGKLPLFWAALNGNTEFAIWANENGCQLSDNILKYAAMGGHIGFAKWARKKGCQWTKDTMPTAAYHNHLVFAKWAYSEGCIWGDKTMQYCGYFNNIDFAEWAYSHECPWGNTIEVAKLNNSIEFVNWALKNGCPRHHIIANATLRS